MGRIVKKAEAPSLHETAHCALEQVTTDPFPNLSYSQCIITFSSHLLRFLLCLQTIQAESFQILVHHIFHESSHFYFKGLCFKSVLNLLAVYPQESYVHTVHPRQATF